MKQNLRIIGARSRSRSRAGISIKQKGDNKMKKIKDALYVTGKQCDYKNALTFCKQGDSEKALAFYNYDNLISLYKNRKE